MADAYHRSLYFSLDSPGDLKLLGMLLALPRWRRSNAISTSRRSSTARRSVLTRPVPPSGTPWGAAGVALPRLPSASSSPRVPFERARAREVPESAEGIVRAKQAPEVQTATRRLETKLDELMKRSWIG